VNMSQCYNNYGNQNENQQYMIFSE
jgi:hypothetical protein